MDISLNWLKEFISLSNISPEQIKEKLTAHTVEVEKITKKEDLFKNIVVAKIKEIEKHPKADKLQIATVDAGEDEMLRIVCGASNIEIGQYVPLAKIGAVLPNGLKIEKVKIREEESSGMICSERELEIGSNHEGIMVLEDNPKIGQSIGEYLKLNDITIEVDNKSISNRPDLWGHYGIARELGVIFEKKIKNYESKGVKIKEEKKGKNIEVKIKNKNLCKKYLAIKIDNVTVEESPLWLKKRLLSINVRPVNNIVDATNYVMFETGQPLHSFDSSEIEKIEVRRADKNESLKTLEDKMIQLGEDDVVISSKGQAIALAGIIGGKDKEVNKTTTSIIIESASFDAISIRKTAQRLGLRTDAAMRFEKGLDPTLCSPAIDKACELIKKICPNATFKNKLIEEGLFQEDKYSIEIDLNWVNKIIGEDIGSKKIFNILNSLGLSVEKKDEEIWNINIPSWRRKDLKIKEDIIEEIVRIYGYNNIKAIIPKSEIAPPKKDQELSLIKLIKKTLSTGYKMNEVYNYSFVNESQLEKLGINHDSYIKILNPLTSQCTHLRKNIASNLIANIKTNQSKYESIKLFEIGNIFLNISGNISKEKNSSETLPFQEKKLGMILGEETKNTFFSLKNIFFNAMQDLSREVSIEFLPTDSIIEWADSNEKCLISINKKEVGFVAKINKEVASKNNIKKEVSCLEVSMDKIALIMSKADNKKYKEIPKFPPINRDLAFVIDEKIFYNDIKREIENFSDLIKKVELFDVYSGQNLEANRKSMAFHIIYQSEEKTLKNNEVDLIQESLIKHFEDKFSAKIRNF
jgi:phenylalanyl-tRNA synthetase beta chain